jgi:pimeloyl-ACP methyl ester carboxylesterase
MTTCEHDVRLTDGRIMRVLDAGTTGRPTVVFVHGAPASRLVPDLWLDAIADAGIRLLSCDRPGYGGSTPQVPYSVVDQRRARCPPGARQGPPRADPAVRSEGR